MNVSQRDAHHLIDLFNHARRINQFLAGVSREAFDANLEKQAAVLHHLLIIGEIAGRLSAAFTQGHPKVPWRNIVVMRNRLVHDYDEVDLDLVWNAGVARIPELIGFLEPLLPVLPGES